MIYQYVVTIRNKNTRSIDLLGFFLSAASCIFFIEEMSKSGEIGIAYLTGSVFVSLLLIWNILQSKRGKKVYYSRALLIAGLVWMKMPVLQWLSLVFFLLALLEYQAKYAIEIGFSENEVVMNNLIKKRYQWSEFNNIVLKDGLLTMDFKSNQLYQKEVLEDEEDDAEEDEFNDYCKQQLSRLF
jgi:hypothetical protein